MSRRAVVTIGFVAFLSLFILGFAAEKPGSTAPAGDVAAPATANPSGPVAAPAADRQIIAYYFHGTVRCPTCRGIEATAAAVLQERFHDDLEAKRLEWRVVNYDEAANEHFIKDYQLVASSLVLVDTLNGKQQRFKNLDKVWQYAHDEERLKVYVRDEVAAFLKDKHA